MSTRLPELNVEAEYTGIKDAVLCSGSQATVQLDVAIATLENLSRLGMVAPDPHGSVDWWHISAHTESQTGRLVLEDEDGCAHTVQLNTTWLLAPRPPLGAMVLACGSRSIGDVLLRCGVLFVLVAVGPLMDAAARTFTRHFYRILLSLPTGPLPLEAAKVRTAFETARELLRSAPRAEIRAEAAKLLLLEPTDYFQIHPLAPPGPEAGAGPSPVESNSLVSPWVAPVPSLDVTKFTWQPVGTRELGRPEDCEDFVGRAQELCALMRLLGSQARRLVVLHGPEGIGKSALCAEFCRVASGAGRRFSAVQTSRSCNSSQPRLTFVSLRGPPTPTDMHSVGSLERPDPAYVHTLLLSAAALVAPDDGEHAAQACMVIDHAEPELGWWDSFASEILSAHPTLRLLLARRQPLFALSDGNVRWKPVNVRVTALSLDDCATLFLRRVHRPLTQQDFIHTATCNSRSTPLRPTPTLITKLAAHPTLLAGGGNPKRVVRLASLVTPELPSLYDVAVEASTAPVPSVASACS